LTSPEEGDDGGELAGTKFKKNKGKVTLPRDEENPTKKRKVTPPKPSFRKKARATRATFKTTLTSNDFDLLVIALNDASLEIAEKKEAKQEEVFSRIKGELQEVQRALQSNHVVSLAPSTSGTEELGDEPAQLHQIANKFEDHLRRAQEETAQDTQALEQA
jgi:NTP pyrophosphatase (non-canonical NTP hydrolase)